MAEAFQTLLQQLGAAETAAAAVNIAVRDAYRTNELAYHNLTHIHETLAFAGRWRHLADNFTAVSLALWFHDVVYNPRAADNEALSAAMATRLLTSLDLDPILIDRVAALILVTRAHTPAEVDKDGGLIADADLAILGAAPAVYDVYRQAIRQEYDFVAETAFRAGRVTLLQKFLNRPSIYFHPPIRQLLEAQARQNIAREITALLAT